MAKFRITNILKQQSLINQMIFQQAKTKKFIFNRLETILKLEVREINALCQKNQATPADLPAPSRAAYAWMEFLTDEENLHRHCQVVSHALEIADSLIKSHSAKSSSLLIELVHSSAVYKAKITPQLTHIQLSEGFIAAEKHLIQSVMESVLIKKIPETKNLIRRFANSEAYREIILELDLIAQVFSENAQGEYHDLDELFRTVSQEYLDSSFLKPRLCWNSILTTRKLGHYESARDRVVLSPSLDRKDIPSFVVEFVLYHELLHKHHGVEWLNGKRMVHTPAFRRSEKKFRFYDQAIAFLKQMGTEEVF
jgi:hypothetical protein